MNIPIRVPNPCSDIEAAQVLVERAPEFHHHSKCDWGVIIYGGHNPRTGFAQIPMEFNFFGPHYSRKQIERRAADLCEREHRTSFVIQEPSDPRFMEIGSRMIALSDEQLRLVSHGGRNFGRGFK